MIRSVGGGPLQNRGLAGTVSLSRHVEAEARTTPGVCGLRLYMEHDNHRARAAYVKLGMRSSGYEVFEVVFTDPKHRA